MSDRRRARQKKLGRADKLAASAAARRFEMERGARCRRCGARWKNAPEYLAKQTDLLECNAGHLFRRRPQPIAFTREEMDAATPQRTVSTS